MSKLPKLADIEAEIQNALTSLDDFEGPEDEKQRVMAALEPYLTDLANQEAAKVDHIAYFDRRADKEIAFLKEEEARIARKRKSIERRKEYFRYLILQAMTTHGLKKVPGLTGSISLRPTSRVEVDEPSKLPSHLVTVTTTYAPDKLAIGDALKAGEIIPGCRIVTGQTVQVR